MSRRLSSDSESISGSAHEHDCRAESSCNATICKFFFISRLWNPVENKRTGETLKELPPPPFPSVDLLFCPMSVTGKTPKHEFSFCSFNLAE